MISSTDNRSFKQTNLPFFCASSCPSYLKSSYYEINMRSRPRSWPSSVASRPAGRPAGRPGSGRSRRRGRWQRCFTLRRFERYPGVDCKLDSNHWTVDCTVFMGLELWEKSSSTHFFLHFLKSLILKTKKKCVEDDFSHSSSPMTTVQSTVQ